MSATNPSVDKNLTPAEMSTLSRALTLKDRFGAGIFWRGSSQAAHFGRMVKRGLLVEVGRGTDIDREDPRDDVPLYQLTDLGERCARAEDAGGGIAAARAVFRGGAK